MKNLKGIRLATWIVALIFGCLSVIALIVYPFAGGVPLLIWIFTAIVFILNFVDMALVWKGISKAGYIALGVITIIFGSLPVGILMIVCITSLNETNKQTNKQ